MNIVVVQIHQQCVHACVGDGLTRRGRMVAREMHHWPTVCRERVHSCAAAAAAPPAAAKVNGHICCCITEDTHLRRHDNRLEVVQGVVHEMGRNIAVRRCAISARSGKKKVGQSVRIRVRVKEEQSVGSGPIQGCVRTEQELRQVG